MIVIRQVFNYRMGNQFMAIEQGRLHEDEMPELEGVVVSRGKLEQNDEG
jgi:uncharacterized protein YydD (DUF2326 family)